MINTLAINKPVFFKEKPKEYTLGLYYDKNYTPSDISKINARRL